MTREEAIERIKARFDKWALDNDDLTALQALDIVDTDSEDERIRKSLIEVFKKKLEKGFEWVEYGIPNRSVLDWLEKQKEQKPAQYDLDVLEKHITKDSISELAHTVMIRNGWDIVEQEQKCSLNFDVISSWLRDHVSNYVNGEFNEFHHCVEYDGTINVEKLIADLKVAVDSGTFDVYEQKEQKPAEINGEEERIRKHIVKFIDEQYPTHGNLKDEKDKMLAYLEKQKEQPTNEEMLRTLRAEYEKGVADTIAKYEQKEQKPEEKPINWTELTWEDINELEDIINKVHYEFRNGIGQESFGKEVLEQFREYKGDEYLDGIEEKPVEWSRESIINALTKWLTEKIAPLHKKSLDGTITEKEEMFEAALLEMRSFVYSPDFQIGKDTSAEWSEDIIRKAVKEVGLTQHQIDWFKTNVFPPKQEWSVEDEEMFFFINELMENKGRDYFTTLVYDAVQNWLKNRFKSLRPKKNISYGELPLVSIDYVEGLDTDFEKQVGAVIASAMNREHQFTSKYIKWTAQRLIECAKDKQNSEEEHVSDNKEWSEDDENAITTAIRACRYMTENFENSTKQYEDAMERLKSLRPHWKPSEEQMEALNEIINTLAVSKHPHENDYLFNILNGLRKNLKSIPRDWVTVKEEHWKPREEQMGALNYAYCELFKREDVGHNILGPLQNLIDTLSKL